MNLEHSDRRFNPPDVCKTCGRFYAYKHGQCYECYAADESGHADQQREERLIQERSK